MIKNLSKNKVVVTKPAILIVEDHEALRASLQRWLSVFFPDLYFLEAQNGEEALEIVKAHRPRVVLMDVNLPKMNGIEATRCIKETLPDIKVIILSMYDANDYKSAASLAGASAYIPKHRMYSELLSVINKLLSNNSL